MAKKVNQEMIAQMIELYEKLGTYSAVAKEIGVSASTVSKYIKEQNSSKTYNSYTGPEPSIDPPEKNIIINFSSLSQQEQDSYRSFLKEYGYVF